MKVVMAKQQSIPTERDPLQVVQMPSKEKVPAPTSSQVIEAPTATVSQSGNRLIVTVSFALPASLLTGGKVPPVDVGV
jgi:hypothetical protein